MTKKKNKGKQKNQTQKEQGLRHYQEASKIGKKRRRSKTTDVDVQVPVQPNQGHIKIPKSEARQQINPDNAKESGSTSTLTSIIPHVIQWLEKRKKRIPDELKDNNIDISIDMDMLQKDQLFRLLPSLRERERRALLRHIDKCIHNQTNGGVEQKPVLDDSDGEYDINSDNPVDADADADANKRVAQFSGESWPAHVQFSNNYRWDAAVPSEIREKYSPAPPTRVRQRTPRLSQRVYFQRITDPNHPAHGEFGLYCALPHAAPGSWLLDYVGHVTLGEHQDKESDYVSDFGSRSELACDADSFGNEARFLNDFRNTGHHPNVEFNIRRDRNGELRQGIYVKLKKDAKGEGFDGVRQHEELLVSYGKSYWRSRVGNLTDFVWRLPGHPMPEGGKPPMGSGHERKPKGDCT